VRCKKVRRKLGAYLDGELKQRQKELIKEHLKKCVDCRQELTLLAQLSKTLKGWKEMECSDNFEVKVWQSISLEKEKRFSFQDAFWWAEQIFLPVGIAIILIAGVVFLNDFLSEKSSPQTYDLEEEYFTLSALDSFQDISPDSLSEVYIDLILEEESQ